MPTIDLENRRISPTAANQTAARMTSLSGHSWPIAYLQHRFFSKLLLLPALDKTVKKTAFGQTAVETALLACALERFRLAHNGYPASLDTLVPEFVAKLPHDIISGQPFKYQLTEADRYVLYSVGWNERDDGGVVSGIKSGEDTASEQGDWVWRLP